MLSEFSTQPDKSPASASCRSEATSRLPTLRSIFPLILIEFFFAVSGGFLDAYAFIAHGHVFANAQTGNVVFFAMYAAEDKWSDAFRHVPPVMACILGVSAAKLLGAHFRKRPFRATLLCQGIELFALSGVALFASQLPNVWVVPILSFVAALQYASFDSLGPWTFNSAMTTGNLTSATTGLVFWLIGVDRSNNRGKAVVSTVACLAFLIGALMGSFVTSRNAVHALFVPVSLVLIGLILTWRKRNVNAGTDEDFAADHSPLT